MGVSDTFNMFSNIDGFQPLNQLLETIMNLDDATLNDEVIEVFTGVIKGAFPVQLQERMITNLVNDFKSERLNRTTVAETVANAKQGFVELINNLHPSEYKRKILENLFNIFNDIFDRAAEAYHAADIVLPIKLDKGAYMPTYAHEDDAAADLYALEDMVLPAHSISNMIKTGVHIGLPEGWMAMIFPRSSIGAKTGLRLSNSAGIIDQSYLGGLGVIYDNISDSDYTIHAGDRIAQLLVMPSYRFKAEQVDSLGTTERGENGFGSTGK